MCTLQTHDHDSQIYVISVDRKLSLVAPPYRRLDVAHAARQEVRLQHDLLVEERLDDVPDRDEVRRHAGEARRAEPARVVQPQHVDALAHVRQRGGAEAGEVHQQADALDALDACNGRWVGGAYRYHLRRWEEMDTSRPYCAGTQGNASGGVNWRWLPGCLHGDASTSEVAASDGRPPADGKGGMQCWRWNGRNGTTSAT